VHGACYHSVVVMSLIVVSFCAEVMHYARDAMHRRSQDFVLGAFMHWRNRGSRLPTLIFYAIYCDILCSYKSALEK